MNELLFLNIVHAKWALASFSGTGIHSFTHIPHHNKCKNIYICTETEGNKIFSAVSSSQPTTFVNQSLQTKCK
jgi:hypothetical protein